MLPFWIMNCSLFPPHISKSLSALVKLQRVQLSSVLLGWRKLSQISLSLLGGRTSSERLISSAYSDSSQASTVCDKGGEGEAAPQHEPHTWQAVDRLWQSVLIWFSLTQLPSLSNKIKKNEKGPLVKLQEIKVNG